MTTVNIISWSKITLKTEKFDTFWDARIWAEEQVTNRGVAYADIKSGANQMQIGSQQ